MKHKAGGSPTRWTPTCCTSATRVARSKIRRRSPRKTCGAGRCRRRRRRTRAEYLELEYARGDIVAVNGKTMSAGAGAHGAQPARRQARRRPARPGREPLRRHEVARLLRDTRRHHHAEGASGDRIDLPRPRGRASQGRSDAALREPDLQRLLVVARAQDAADDDRCVAGAASTAGCASSSTRATSSSSAAIRSRTRCSTRRSRPSRKTAAPTIRRTPTGFIKLNALRMRIETKLARQAEK